MAEIVAAGEIAFIRASTHLSERIVREILEAYYTDDTGIIGVPDVDAISARTGYLRGLVQTVMDAHAMFLVQEGFAD